MTKSLNKDVARVIRGLLAVRGMQDKDFAAAMGASTSSVSRWLKGGTFDTDRLEAFADGLDMEVQELIRLAILSRSLNNGEFAGLLGAVDSTRRGGSSGSEGQGSLTGS